MVAALDIGGTLAKLVFFEPGSEPTAAGAAGGGAARVELDRVVARLMAFDTYGDTGVRDNLLCLDIPELNGKLHFIRFETARMREAVQFAAEERLTTHMQSIFATGGGAHRFQEVMQQLLGVEVLPQDELACLIRGVVFLLRQAPEPAFTYLSGQRHSAPSPAQVDVDALFPFLLVNIGSGTSILLVESESSWRRVSGTSVGGATFFGLSHLITGMSDFDRMIRLAAGGRHANVDLQVGDIYGGKAYLGLKASAIASSFGKIGRHHRAATTARDRDSAVGSQPASPGAAAAAAAAAAAGGEEEESVGRTRSGNGLPRPGAKGGAPEATSVSALQPDELRQPRPRHLRARAKSMEAMPKISPANGPGAGSDADWSMASRLRRSRNMRSVSMAVPADRPATTPDIAARLPGGTTAVDDVWLHSDGRLKVEAADACRSVLLMVSNTIGQVAYLNARRFPGVRRVMFTGNFLKSANHEALRTLAYAIRFWSGGDMEAVFLRHEGYGGAVGAFLAALDAKLEASSPEEAD